MPPFPQSNWLYLLGNRISTSRSWHAIRRRAVSLISRPHLKSDVSNAVYFSWVIDESEVKPFLPPGSTVWKKNGKTIFTILTYTHGHFGPHFLGPLRKFFPSPLQSNWRFYLQNWSDEIWTDGTVLFVKNVLNSPLYTLASRLLSDALPSELSHSFIHKVESDVCEDAMEYGNESKSKFACSCSFVTKGELSGGFEAIFPSWLETVKFICLQDAAVTYLPDIPGMAHVKIELDIDFNTVRPLGIRNYATDDAFLKRIGAIGSPFCFLVSKVGLRVLSERFATMVSAK
jgi:hypothetical protein